MNLNDRKRLDLIILNGTASATSPSTNYNVTATIDNAVAATATFTIVVA